MHFMKQSLILAVISLCVIACGSKTEKKDDKGTKEDVTTNPPAEANESTGKLDGNWVIKRAEGSMAEMNVGTVYSFKGSKLSFGKDGFQNPGTTEVTDSTFTFQADGNQYKFDYYYQFNGDTMVVRMKNGTQVFHLVKE